MFVKKLARPLLVSTLASIPLLLMAVAIASMFSSTFCCVSEGLSVMASFDVSFRSLWKQLSCQTGGHGATKLGGVAQGVHVLIAGANYGCLALLVDLHLKNEVHQIQHNKIVLWKAVR